MRIPGNDRCSLYGTETAFLHIERQALVPKLLESSHPQTTAGNFELAIEQK